jgi:hypothetical protein
MRVYTYNFPCSFAIEKVDRTCRVVLYGHGKRGTEGPIFVFNEGTPYWDYFSSQLEWMKRLADAHESLGQPKDCWCDPCRPVTCRWNLTSPGRRVEAR